MPIVSLPAALAVWTCTNGRVAPTAPAVTFSARRRVIRWTRVMGCSSLLCALLPCILFFELNFRCLRHPRCLLRLAGQYTGFGRLLSRSARSLFVCGTGLGASALDSEPDPVSF